MSEPITDLTREELTEFARLVSLAAGPFETPPNPLTRIVDRQRLGEWCGERGGEGLVFLRLVSMAQRALATADERNDEICRLIGVHINRAHNHREDKSKPSPLEPGLLYLLDLLALAPRGSAP